MFLFFLIILFSLVFLNQVFLFTGSFDSDTEQQLHGKETIRLFGHFCSFSSVS